MESKPAKCDSLGVIRLDQTYKTTHLTQYKFLTKALLKWPPAQFDQLTGFRNHRKMYIWILGYIQQTLPVENIASHLPG
jgi:hypothetical protein